MLTSLVSLALHFEQAEVNFALIILGSLAYLDIRFTAALLIYCGFRQWTDFVWHAIVNIKFIGKSQEMLVFV